MSISFSQIPEDIRVPLFYAEVDNTRAGGFSQNLRALILGYPLSTKNAEAGRLQPISTVDHAQGLFGFGSMLSRQVAAFRAQSPLTELWVYPIAEPVSGTKASGTVTFSGTSTQAGHVYLYIAGQLIQIPIPSGTAAADVATIAKRYIQRQRNNSDVFRDLPVTANNVVDSNPTAVLTFTAKNKGTHGNSIDLRLNYNVDTGERLPPGLTATVVAMSGGTGSATLADALADIGDEPFEYIVSPFNGTSDIGVLSDWLEERWGPMKQLYGQAWTAKTDTYANLLTYGEALNYKTVSVLAYRGAPAWEVEVGAAYGGIAARYLRADPARQLNSLELVGIMPPPVTERFSIDEMNALLFAGVSPMTVGGGDARISRSVTTYQVNEFDAEDMSYLETTRPATLARVIREVKNLIVRKFPRAKVLPDSAVVGGGQVIVTPKKLKAELIVHYESMCRRGLVRNAERFEDTIRVQINQQDHTRMDILYTPILVSPLNIVATRIQFRI